jgi:Fe-S oxidoreductase
MNLVFLPMVFGFLMNLMIGLSPVFGKIITMLLGEEKKVDTLDYELSLHACARCGSCLSECPAYLVTGNEAVTAKGKIALARKLLKNQSVSREEAWNAFLCMHCKACEEVCQTNLELMSLWDALEAKIESKYGKPDTQIKEFLTMVDENEEYWDMVELRNQASGKKPISTGTE